MGIKISNSRAKTYQRCRQMFTYKYELGLRKKLPGLPLKRGIWLHELLEVDASGGDWKKRHKELKREFNKMFAEEKEEYGDLPGECARIMRSYKYWWKKEDENMDVLATELELEIPLPHGHTLVAKIDRVTQDEYGIWIWEHKSHAKFPSANWRFIDIQSSLYWWALRKDGRFGEPTGILWDYIITKPPTKPKLNKDGTLSKRKVSTDLLTYVSALREYGIDLNEHRDMIMSLKKHSKFFRRDRVPRDKHVVKTLVKELVRTADDIDKGVVPYRSIDKSCEYQCDYMDICLTQLYGGDASVLMRTKFDVKGGEEDSDEKEYSIPEEEVA